MGNDILICMIEVKSVQIKNNKIKLEWLTFLKVWSLILLLKIKNAQGNSIAKKAMATTSKKIKVPKNRFNKKTILKRLML